MANTRKVKIIIKKPTNSKPKTGVYARSQQLKAIKRA